MSNFIIFILILFAIAAILRIDFFFTILYLFLAVYILSTIWARRMIHQIHFERSLTPRAFIGDTVTVTLTLTNRGWLPIPWLMLKESLPAELSAPPLREVTTLGSRERTTTTYNLTAWKRGYYRVGPLQIRTGDILGLRRELTGQFPASHLIIYPRVVPITKLGLPTHSPQVILPTPLPIFRDPSRLTGIRDYTPGDNPRHIHWPATAATGQLSVKQFQPAIARESAIFLNLDRLDYARRGYPDLAIELAIIVAASLAHHIVTVEQLPVGLVTTAFDPLTGTEQTFQLPPTKGRDQLMHILEILARVRDQEETHFLARLRQAAVHLSWGTTLIIITSYATLDLQQSVLWLKRAGFRVTVILVDPPRTRATDPPDRIDLTDIPHFEVRSEKDIEVWQPSS